ncbi:beta-fructofuranosidase, insoluble isoenzyme 3 [Sorghum bicolor]|nr:beta-fructofuranosidase, insoluble isoenzyme 3 [Sorghum bicolor]|eukprot:XP_021307351.1 beta-fructofuranosidase, insoluble isoenzyme 3 [Sorghum bicolor]
MYYKGVYHLFYQYNPKGAVWGNIVWAHAVSTDLVDWVMLPPAIYPTAPFDVNGCWSGSATVLPDGTPVIMYTGIDGENRQVQNVAYPKDLSDPYLREWVKPDYNPVIAPGPGMNATAFRDPTTAWQGPDGLWRLVIGTKDNHRGLAMLYRSRDFKRWAPARRALHSGDTGMWECPDFYPVNSAGVGVSGSGGRKHVLKVSLDLTRFEYYTFGEYDDATDTYVPDAAIADGNDGLRYDYGNFYASKTFLDTAKQRRILWGWANESDSTADDLRKGWAGVQAVPRKVWLAPDGKQLVQWPVAEIESLRGNHVNVTDTLVKAGQHFEVSGLASPAQADVEAAFQVMDLDKAEPFDPAWRGADAETVCAARGAEAKGGVGPFGLWVLASDDLKERTAVFFRVFKGGGGGDGGKHVVLMCNDPSMSSHADNLYKPTFAGFVDVEVAQTGGKIPLRTLIDHSVVESFGAHGKTCILSRVYPTKAVGDKARLYVFNNGESDVKVTHLNAYEMRSAKITADVK